MKFENPYLDVPKDQQHKTTVFFDVADISDLQKMHPRKGTVQTMVGILTVKLLEQLRKNELVQYNPRGLEQLIATCRIELDANTVERFFGKQLRSAVAQPSTGKPAKAAAGNVRRRASSVPRKQKEPAPESSNSGSGGPSEDGEDLTKYR